MSKALIITEKPSVARDLIAVLGGFEARASQAFWESRDYLCTYAVGHILSLLEPEDIDPSLKQWRLATLPIIPHEFCYKPVSGQEKRLAVIKELAARTDVSMLINACDAAREGELIFREITRHLKLKQPVKRLWLQSMTPEAIKDGFRRLKSGHELDGLGAAAACRASADWLIGMNATRAFSLKLRSPSGADGEQQAWSVGRVQTPTLALLVRREKQILEHVARPYFRVTARFQATDHVYEGVWYDPAFKKKATSGGGDQAVSDERDDRIFSKEKAEALCQGLLGQTAEAHETREESVRHAPYLFNLTALQKHMATRFKWTSRRTLEAAQRCYEQHKVLTYPRTSSSCLPEDYRGEVERLVAWLAGDATVGKHAQVLMAQGLRNTKKVFNDAGVSDHFAIIPTGKERALTGDDQKLYEEVQRRFLAAFYPAAIYDKVKRETLVKTPRGQEHFRTGPVESLRVAGWLEVTERRSNGPKLKSPQKASEKVSLPPLWAGAPSKGMLQQKAAVVPLSASTKEETTKPPPRINEAGLLGLMEHAGRQVQDEELAAALMSAEGLGTAATRADIIQNLKTKLYVDDSLRPTVKGIRLIDTLERLKAERLTSAELTALLERDLSRIERDAAYAKSFMQQIERYVSDVVMAAKALDEDVLFPAEDPVGRCPVCRSRGGSSVVFEKARFYICAERCGFHMPKNASGRYLDRTHATMLLDKGETPPLEGFRDVQGQGFQGWLERRAGERGEEIFICRLDEKRGETAIVAMPLSMEGPAPRGGRQTVQGGTAKPGAQHTAVGSCPVHEACLVIETARSYTCEKRLEAFKAGHTQLEGFFVPKQISGRPLTRAECIALLERGETAELVGFTSKAGRPFTAKLLRTPSGSFAFQFPSRPLQGAPFSRSKDRS